MNYTQELLPQLRQKISPQLIAANHILELSTQELQQAISQELEENPALELVEQTICPTCGDVITTGACVICARRETKTEPPSESGSTLDEYQDPYQPARQVTDEDFDPMTQVASQWSLSEQLLMDLAAVLPPEDMAVAEYVVGNLDEKGYLRSTYEEIAFATSAPVQQVERVARALQGLEPVGVGARNLGECLLIQLDFLENWGITQPFVREIALNHLHELGEHKMHRIAHQLGATVDEIADAWEFIKRNLNPHPAEAYVPDHSAAAGAPPQRVLPDVIIRAKDSGFEIEVVESRRFLLRINSLYRNLWRELEQSQRSLSDDDKTHIRQFVSRSKMFISNINQRRQTLHKIATCLARYQEDFLKYGVRHLKPLTRAALAAELDIHESTVSRATASKYVMLPSGRVIPFSDFFVASLSVKDVMREIIESEPEPLTDQEIAQRLAQWGIHIARRTVAKYRAQLKILPSPYRGATRHLARTSGSRGRVRKQEPPASVAS